MIKLGLTLLAVSSTLFAAPQLWAAPEPMSRDAIIDLAASGVDFSYYWGRGSWRSDGTQHGSCSGNCPNCTHSGTYGADCSGFVAKAWQVPGPSPVETNAHPYSTRSFRYGDTHWTHIDRGNIQRADALVYRNSANSGGHTVVYESGDPWGQAWAYEARGCNYGIVHNLRSFGSSYVAIERHNLTAVPSTGVLKGVVFVDRGQGTADMSERLTGAQVSISGGPSTTTTGADAGWSFTLAPGNYGTLVSVEGYNSASRHCTVTAGEESWCSIGVAPVCVPDCGARSCGLDPVCGTSCGSCSGEESCGDAGRCEPPPCVPDCSGLRCGLDPICGTSCGSCADDETCDEAGQCEAPPCVPDCDAQTCGADPLCGASCGNCQNFETCVDGACLPPRAISVVEQNEDRESDSSAAAEISDPGTRQVELGQGLGCRALTGTSWGWGLLLPLLWVLGWSDRRRRS